MLVAAALVAVALANTGCVGTIRGALSPTSSTPTPVQATATPLPTATATPVPTPTPVPGHVDLIYTTPLEAGNNRTSAIHVLTGNITYNGKPADGYSILIDTIPGCEYGNKTDVEGWFHVTFRDDGSPTYIIKVMDPSNIVLYTDKSPRPVNLTGPVSVRIERSTSGQVTVSVTP